MLGPINPSGLVARAVVAILLCFCVLYLPAAIWGFRARQPLGVVAASTFGTVGSEWITGIGLALAGVYWCAVTFDFAVDATLLGLESMGLLDRSAWSNITVGSVSIRPPVFLVTAYFWIFIIRTAFALGLTSVIVALMKIYTPVALLLLTVVAALMLPSFLDFRQDDLSALLPPAGADPNVATRRVFDRILGFFVIVGLTSVDWGASARRGRDIVLGGLIGIVGVATWTSSMALIIVAGAAATIARDAPTIIDATTRPLPLSFRWAIFHAIGGKVGGVILILFALAALAPACYQFDRFGSGFMAHWPLRRRGVWRRIGTIAIFALVALGWSRSINVAEQIIGCAFAPVAGAIATDFCMQRGRWPGVRPNLNPAGLLAICAGLLLEIGLTISGAILAIASVVPAAVLGFAASAAVYFCLSAIGLAPLASPLQPTSADQQPGS